jgi:O-antigen/teichoic acid export membrane protein
MENALPPEPKTPGRFGATMSKLRSLLRVAFTKPPTDDSPASRSQQRYHRAALTTLAMSGEKIIRVVSSLAIIPITIDYFGSDEFGLWLAITAVVAFLRFADLGLGVGLQNALGECHGRGDRTSPAGYVSTALGIAGGIFALMTVFALVALPYLPLDRLLKVDDADAALRLVPTAQAALIAFALGLPCGILQRIYNAYQEGYIAIIWLTIGRIAAFAALLGVIHFKLTLPWLAAVWMGVPWLALAVGSLRLFYRRPALRPSLAKIDRAKLNRLMRTGGASLVVQVANVAVLAFPPLAIANQIEAGAVTPFALPQRLLGLTTLALASLLQPLWPAYSEAAARGDFPWIRRTMRRSMFLATAVTVPFCLAMGFAGQPIIRAWSGSAEAVPDLWLLWGLVAWYLFQGLLYPLSMLLNGLDRLKGQAVYGAGLILAACVSGYLLLPVFGTAAIAWSIAILAMAARGSLMAAEIAAVVRARRHAAMTARQATDGQQDLAPPEPN